jgi:hypothetical protein
MNDKEFYSLINELKEAAKECENAKIVLYNLGVKHAMTCVQLLIEARHIPKLANNRIEKRSEETGLDPIHPDFWDADMIIALYDYFENCIPEVANGN